jgi:CHASE1-domain containing sensor protein
VRLGALSRNQFTRLSGIFDPGGALRNACAAWWRNAYALSIAAAIFGAALTSFAWYAAFQQENRLADQELSARASDHFLALQNGIDQYINDISALRAAFQASEHGISRREFQSLSDDLFRDKPAIFGTSWAPRIAQSERSAHELEATREGLADYSIKTMAADGSLNRAKDADEYFPIFYSSRRDFGAFGLDINDGGIRQRSLERARSTGRPAASANFALRVGEGDRNGFLVALPMYGLGLPHATMEDRRSNFIGVVQGVFQIGAMIEAIIAARTLPTGLDLYFFAADSGADAAPLYFHSSRAQTGPSQPLSRAAIAQGLHWSRELKVADRGWTFTAVPLPGGPGTAIHSGSRIILAGGLLISAMMAAYFWTVGRNTRRLQLGNQRLGEVNRALDIANEHLLAQNARFDAALNNMSQGLVFFDGAQRLIVCNRRLIEMYGLPPDRMRPGITMGEMIDLRWEVGSVPNMTKEEYLHWRNSNAVSNGPSDTTVELDTGRIIRICRQPMPDGGWVATHQDITEQHRGELALAGSAGPCGARTAGRPGCARAPRRGFRSRARRRCPHRLG